jgi:hypothetical protein
VQQRLEALKNLSGPLQDEVRFFRRKRHMILTMTWKSLTVTSQLDLEV